MKEKNISKLSLSTA